MMYYANVCGATEKFKMPKLRKNESYFSVWVKTSMSIWAAWFWMYYNKIIYVLITNCCERYLSYTMFYCNSQSILCVKNSSMIMGFEPFFTVQLKNGSIYTNTSHILPVGFINHFYLIKFYLIK